MYQFARADEVSGSVGLIGLRVVMSVVGVFESDELELHHP